MSCVKQKQIGFYYPDLCLVEVFFTLLQLLKNSSTLHLSAPSHTSRLKNTEQSIRAVHLHRGHSLQKLSNFTLNVKHVKSNCHFSPWLVSAAAARCCSCAREGGREGGVLVDGIRCLL